MTVKGTDYQAQKEERGAEILLESSFGPVIMKYFHDDDVIEIMVNPDGKLWIDRLGKGREYTGIKIPASQVDTIIRIVASMKDTVCNAENPLLEAELPQYNARFQGMIPPAAPGPTFSIRKHSSKVYTLDDYVCQGIMSENDAQEIKKAIVEKKSIVVGGNTSSGKTTLVNGILHEIAKLNERVITIEDTGELQCNAEDFVSLRTVKGAVDMRDLLKASLRSRPDRIIVGEVRGGQEAFMLIQTLYTGHSGVVTVHANGAKNCLFRLEQLVQEVIPTVPREWIAEAIDMVIYIELENGVSRKVKEIAFVKGYDGSNGYKIRNVK